MAPKAVAFGALVLALTAAVTTAQSECTSVIVSMASCLNYVSGSADTPPASCCSALAKVVRTQPRCLCAIVNGGGNSVGVSINQTLALGLPSVCKIVTPPASRCNVVNGPAMSPVGSPESGDDGIPASPSLAGSKATPSDGSTSKGSTTKMNLVGKIIVFITASYASAAFNIF